ncbi:granzyme A-like [Gadus morhua]|uniref:trypsin n=1 Tax=Gadus morhua TaxID=8049 RepID=A0A8C5B8Z1_GADMO|nr:granzyme A-like [Gadus morhua]
MARSLLALAKTLCFILHVQSCTCGEAEIIGGKKVKAHSLPHMALLYNSEEEPRCGGTLLSSTWVLTAAHCFKYKIDTVRLGVVTIKNSKTDGFVQARKVARQYQHPCYNADTNIHDLWLLKLSQAVEETTAIKYLPLANTISDPKEGTICMVAGWGLVKVDIKEMSDDLMSADVTVIKRETCNLTKYNNTGYTITSDMVCAGTVEENQVVRDTCQGDSGGPLMCNGEQVGITSFGIGCANRTKPGVYAFLSKQHIDWINGKIKNESYSEECATQ